MTQARLLPDLSLGNELDTRALGAVIAGHVRAGDTVILTGDLGTGKTTFVQGFVAALDRDIEVTSPTFALCNRYDCSPPVAHVDCWRIQREQELDDLALDELLDDGWVALVEWGERFFEYFGSASLQVVLFVDGDHRGAQLASTSPRWLGCAEELERSTREIGRGRC